MTNAMTNASSAPVIDQYGRRTPFAGMRVFNNQSRRQYQLIQPKVSFAAILERTKAHATASLDVTPAAFEETCADLLETIKGNTVLANLTKGVHVPFITQQAKTVVDQGQELEDDLLPAVGRSFVETHPGFHFKAKLQGDLPLKGHVTTVAGTRHEAFLKARTQGPVAGWYFPTALMEYDVASQRAQMASMPLPDSCALSGGVDVAAALIGSPDMLVNPDTYPPILCCSALQHSDPRLMLCFKSYGLSLEFWALSQMLTPGVMQVSEQWTGGLTVYSVVQ